MILLVLGGTRSGKSEVAERRAASLHGPVTYVATMRADGDPDLDARIAAHRDRRPPAWTTVDAGDDLPGTLRALTGPVLLDSLGPWVAARPDLVVDTPALVTALVERPGDTVVVSDEVGMGVHPATDLGRRFRDALGAVNRQVADAADEVLLVVAGRVLPLERP